MNYRIRLLCLFIILSFDLVGTASAQKNFVKGYMVLLSGDTLRGWINDDEWKVNPKSIFFKRTEDAALTAFSPLQISMFRIEEGNWYISFTGNVDGSSLSVSQLSYNPKPVYVRDTLFLRVLAAGAADLYYARDSRERDHFFIRKAGDTIEELQYNRYLISDYAGTHTRANEGYRSQLLKLVADCPALSSTFMNLQLEYKRDVFVSLLRSYNYCDGKYALYSEAKEKWTFEFSIFGGVNSSKLRFSGSADSYILNTEMERSLGYAAGIGLNAIIPRNNKKWSISNNLFIKNYTAYGNITTGNEPENSVYFDYQYLKLATTMRYAAANGMVKPFFGLGMTNGIALKHVNTRTRDNGSVSNVFDGPRDYEFGLIAEAGLAIKFLFVTGMVETSNGMSPYTLIQSRFATWYLLAGFSF